MFSYLITTLLGLITMNIIYKIIESRFSADNMIKVVLFAIVFLLSIIIFNMIEVEIKYNHEEYLKNLSFKIVMGLIFGVVGLFLIINRENNISSFLINLINSISPNLGSMIEKTIFFTLFIILSLLIAIIDYFTK